MPGSSFVDVLELFEADEQTELIVLSGEIGGSAEEEAADYIAEHVSKPVVAYIAGFTAPAGKQMGHAGAIVSGSAGTAAAKAQALEAKGVRVGRTPTEVGGDRRRGRASCSPLHRAQRSYARARGSGGLRRRWASWSASCSELERTLTAIDRRRAERRPAAAPQHARRPAHDAGAHAAADDRARRADDSRSVRRRPQSAAEAPRSRLRRCQPPTEQRLRDRAAARPRRRPPTSAAWSAPQRADRTPPAAPGRPQDAERRSSCCASAIGWSEPRAS